MRSKALLIGVVAAGALLAQSCAKNPLASSAPGGLNNGTTYAYVNEALTGDVLFAPQSATDKTCRLPNFGGPLVYSWGGASKVGIKSSSGTPVFATVLPANATGANFYGQTPPTTDVLLYTGGVGGPLDYFVRWTGYKGPDASLDYSSFTMYFAGSQVSFDVKARGYRGFIFFARGTGNFGVSLSAGNPGDGYAGPYNGYNFYIKMFGNELDANNWRQITVQFSEMQQLYGSAVDINDVLKAAWGLQFEQQPPLTPDFKLDVDYVRFF